MKRWQRNTLIGLGSFAVLVAVAYYWLIVESSVPAGARFALDIAELRRLANSMAGDKPSAIESERIAAFEFPATAVVAGDGWSTTELAAFAYRVVYPNSAAIIDTGLDQNAKVPNLKGFDAAAYARMQAAMLQASLIVITHEHMDHIGGLMGHPKLSAILPATRLTRDQLAHLELAKPAQFPAHSLDGYVPLAYETYQAVAPGMVLIRAPGHTPGSQMVFVQTAGGAEYLFLGDVAWHYRNVELQRERARLVTAMLLKEDRTAVFGQLVALHELHEAEPRLHIVPGHDGPLIARLQAAGALRPQFSTPTH